MESGQDKRRLAVILAADIVGYSRLMEADESGTLAQLKTHRKELIDPKIAEYGGRIVKTTGDGMLVEFASAADAVQHAVDMQRAIAQRNTAVPADKRIEFRIGINLGDIIVEGDDIFGEGVNVAARLEESCEPGGVNISGKVHAEVAGKLDLAFDDMGEQAVKNLDKPVRTYRVVLEGGAAVAAPAAAKSAAGARSPWLVPAAVAAVVVIAVIAVVAWQTTRDTDTQTAATAPDAAEEQKALALPDKPSIAVLAFDNISADPNLEYFSDGLTEDIITELSRSPELFVISRNSSFVYKGQPTDIQQVAQELGVRYVVEGSVQRAEDQLRITAQLVDGFTGTQLWAENYDRVLTDIFEVQKDVTQSVVAVLLDRVTAAEIAAAFRKPTESLTAYDYAKLGNRYTNEAFQTLSVETAQLGREAYEKAIELDPNYAEAYAWLAHNLFRSLPAVDGRVPEGRWKTQLELTRKAIQLNPNYSFAYAVQGPPMEVLHGLEAGLAVGRKSVELNPNDADSWVKLAARLATSGLLEEAVSAGELAFKLNPLAAEFYYFRNLSQAYYLSEDYQSAHDIAQKGIVSAPRYGELNAILLSALVRMDQLDQASVAAKDALERVPDLGEKFPPFRIFRHKFGAVRKQVIDDLRSLGIAIPDDRSHPVGGL